MAYAKTTLPPSPTMPPIAAFERMLCILDADGTVVFEGGEPRQHSTR